jgi:RNA polymerase sigma-54 factor
MDLKLRLDLKQTQKLLITPTLQQAIKLLQLTKLDLVQLVRQEMVENPVLEEVPGNSPETEAEEDRPYPTEQPEIPAETNKEEPAKTESDFNWEDYFSNDFEFSTGNNSAEREETTWENTFAKLPSLSDHLMWHLRLSTYTDLELKIGEQIIGNTDEHGYLRASTEEIADMLGTEEKLVSEILSIIQTFEPLGVGARDLKECLLLQIAHEGEDGRILRNIISNHLTNLEKKKYKVIAKSLNISIEDVKHYADIICNYDPKPGRKFNVEEARYVIPDVYVYKLDGKYVVMVNDEGIPRLRISNFYKKMLQDKSHSTEKTTKYIQEKMRSAVWLIKSIQQRQMTLYKVANSIVKNQTKFFDKGISYLRPLTLKDIAEDISMHESTVSRVTTNKYIHSPQGIFELKYFFHSGLNSKDGRTISSIRIREMIKQLVAEEDSQKPYTDDQIVKIMQKRNIQIARRTVTKYREAENILSSNKRRTPY